MATATLRGTKRRPINVALMVKIFVPMRAADLHTMPRWLPAERERQHPHLKDPE
jgi:hypothetical protein